MPIDNNVASVLRMKILFFANTDWYLYNFRLALAERLRELGHEILLVAPPGPYGDKLAELGFRFIPFVFSTKSTNPLGDLGVIWRLIRLYRLEKPAMVHHFTIKCVIYGSFAARCAGVAGIVNAVTGLGHIFTNEGRKARLLQPLVKLMYRAMLAGGRVRTIFQNSENRDFFLVNGLVDARRTSLIRGSGVDCEQFAPAPESETSGGTLLFAARLLKEKGVFELVEAFHSVRKVHPHAELLIAGDIYPGNPSSLVEADLRRLEAEPGVRLLGHFDGIQALLAQADIVVLPTYAEGTPRILIEAAAMEKPIVTTDIAGCHGLVVDGENGLLVPVASVEPLAAAMGRLLADSQLRSRFGAAGRKIVLRDFSAEKVLGETLAVYRQLSQSIGDDCRSASENG